MKFKMIAMAIISLVSSISLAGKEGGGRFDPAHAGESSSISNNDPLFQGGGSYSSVKCNYQSLSSSRVKFSVVLPNRESRGAVQATLADGQELFGTYKLSPVGDSQTAKVYRLTLSGSSEKKQSSKPQSINAQMFIFMSAGGVPVASGTVTLKSSNGDVMNSDHVIHCFVTDN
jgi:hypothetical protein